MRKCGRGFVLGSGLYLPVVGSLKPALQHKNVNLPAAKPGTNKSAQQTEFPNETLLFAK
jgi:hypothetical protein